MSYLIDLHLSVENTSEEAFQPKQYPCQLSPTQVAPHGRKWRQQKSGFLLFLHNNNNLQHSFIHGCNSKTIANMRKIDTPSCCTILPLVHRPYHENHLASSKAGASLLYIWFITACNVAIIAGKGSTPP